MEKNIHIHTHTHTHTRIYIYIYIHIYISRNGRFGKSDKMRNKDEHHF